MLINSSLMLYETGCRVFWYAANCVRNGDGGAAVNSIDFDRHISMTLSLVLQNIKTFIYTEIGFLSIIIIINICRFARRRLRLYLYSFYLLFLRGSGEQKEPILSHFNGNVKECAIRFCTRTTRQSGK